MKIFYDLGGLAALRRRVHLAIGAFDGVHLGHQAVLRAARDDAARTGVGNVAAALTFDPLPARVLRPQNPPPLLTLTEHKLALMEAQGLAAAVVQRFDGKFAAMPPRMFLQRLRETLDLQEICVGHNFRFGHKRAGDAGTIIQMGGELGFAVKVIEPVKVGGEIVSSTAVRRAVARGELVRAAAMLGRSHGVWGRVVRGAGRGAKLGFPTANVATEELLPPNGVYAVRARLSPSPLPRREEGERIGAEDQKKAIAFAAPAREKQGKGGTRFDGVANLGVRPTFGRNATPLLEVHFFDFVAKIYGAELEVEFVARIREERKFSSPSELKAQMERDAAAARAIVSP